MMKRMQSQSDIRQLGNILGVWAHPDDESFCTAGIMSAAVENGQKVVCVTATKGESGVQDKLRWPEDKLANIRKKELEKSLKIIGVKDHYFMNIKDGGCDECPAQESSNFIKKNIKKHKPKTILTFGPDGLTGHKDHKTVSNWVGLATKNLNVDVYHVVIDEDSYANYMIEADKQINIFFNINKPPVVAADKCDIFYCLDEKFTNKKLKCLQAMPSQTENMFNTLGEEFVKNAFRTECFVKLD